MKQFLESMETPINYRFSFGPWNISEGSDPFGPDARCNKISDVAKVLEGRDNLIGVCAD